MAASRPMLEDKQCLVYCGPERCNCIRGLGGVQLPLIFETVFGMLFLLDPSLIVILKINNVALISGGYVGTTPNYAKNLKPGESVQIEARRSPSGVVTYWPADSASTFHPDTLDRFGAVFQTVTARSRWQPMDTALRDGTHILVWDSTEVVECFRGDGQRYAEEWIEVEGGPLLFEPEAWRHV